MIDWVIWGVLLIGQNLAHTISQRAKNQDNLWYTLWASVLSNGIWICSNYFMIGQITSVQVTGDKVKAAFVITFYVVWTCVGTVTGQKLAMDVLEKKK